MTASSTICRLVVAALWGVVGYCANASAAESADAVASHGARIYAAQCAGCHGSEGQGVESEYAAALTGDSSIGQLTEIISETMPEDDPELCQGEDAEAVAKYIFETFYSEAARLRNRPPETTLSRLTGDQLRQSLADVYARISGGSWQHEERGIRGTYFDTPNWKNEAKKIERTDAVLDFDFGHEGPGEGIDPAEYYIHWAGSLMADRSGEYEIVLRSTCSCKLYLGSPDRIFIDNHVQSAGRTEFRKRIHLTAGRGYPIKLDYTQRKRKTEQPPASVSLSWVPPGGVETVIPQRQLISASFPAAFSLQTKLPPDDRSYGYERGTEISRIWDDSTTQAAVEFSKLVAEELWPHYERKNRKKPNENRARLRSFLEEIVSTAFRGPLDDVTRKVYIDKQLDATDDDAEAIRRVMLLSLKSPRFLYPLLDSNRSPSQRAANRLALVLFDSLPADEWLLKQIQKNELEDSRAIEQAAWKMVNDYRTQAKTRDFLTHWFEVADSDDISKDEAKHPGFNEAVLSDLRASFHAMIDEIVWSETSDYRQLFQADWAYTTPRIAAVYGDAWKPKSAITDAADDQAKGHETNPLVPSAGVPDSHLGLLNHPLLMSKLAYYQTTSPIHRGVFLYRHLFGRVLRPPNAAFSPLNADLHPQLTTRQRVELQTNEVNCQVCHEKINGLGFTLENFDAIGRFRETENDRPIDASGSYEDRNGNKVTFKDARDLANYLAKSEDAHRAFVEAAFEYFVKQPIGAYGPDKLSELTERFRNSGFKVRDLIVWIAATAATEPVTSNQET
ncbi:DUF1588 domain-containing protein [Novipirellula caenicola]|uniref:DUF1588 domain-containing protein n=1 Tax=Novipirellula caenicola TaxID=1536901 RepID=UPI0031EF8E07